MCAEGIQFYYKISNEISVGVVDELCSDAWGVPVLKERVVDCLNAFEAFAHLLLAKLRKLVHA